MVSLLGVLLTGAIGYQLYFYRRRRQLERRSWDEVLGSVEPVNLEGLQLIADCYLHPDKDQLKLEPPLMWELIGGSDGLRCLSKNASAMLALAVYAQRWNKTESLIVSEMIRRDALRVATAGRHLRRSLLIGGASASDPFHLQEAVSSYCLMRRRLFGLYHNSHIALVPQLTAAL